MDQLSLELIVESLANGPPSWWIAAELSRLFDGQLLFWQVETPESPARGVFRFINEEARDTFAATALLIPGVAVVEPSHELARANVIEPLFIDEKREPGKPWRSRWLTVQSTVVALGVVVALAAIDMGRWCVRVVGSGEGPP